MSRNARANWNAPVSFDALFMDDSERDLVLESAGWEDYLLKKAAAGSDPVGRELFDEVRVAWLPPEEVQ